MPRQYSKQPKLILNTSVSKLPNPACRASPNLEKGPPRHATTMATGQNALVDHLGHQQKRSRKEKCKKPYV